MRDLQIDETFERSYEIEWLYDLPRSKRKRYDFDPSGPILEVTIDGEDPIVLVVPGNVETMRIQTLPDPYKFLILPDALMVDLRTPEAPAKLKTFLGHGVHYATSYPEAKVFVAGHCCGLACFSHSGVWEIGNDYFCCDDPIVSIDGLALIVTGDRHGGGPETHRLDLATGLPLSSG